MDDEICEHCGQDLVAHHHRNLLCPPRKTIYKRAVPCPSPSSDLDVYSSWDAKVWAGAFIERVRLNPAIATDEGAMLAWFASAIMRGYDERHWRSKEYKQSVRRALVPWWKRWLGLDLLLERRAR